MSETLNPPESYEHGQPLSYRLSSDPPSSHTSREFRRLIDALHDGIMVATEHGLAFANLALLRLLGYPDLDALLSRTPAELLECHVPEVHRQPATECARAVLLGQVRHAHLEQTLVIQGARELSVQYFFDSIEFEGAPAVLITVRDLTETLALGEKLSRAERMASVGTLAAGVAHEINNPLAYVTTNIAYCVERIRYLEELLEGKSIQLGSPASLRAMLAPMAQALTEAHQGTSRVATIVRDLRALTRDDKDVDSAVDLTTAIASAVHMSESETRFRCTVHVDTSRVGTVSGNETRIAQVFLNLIINAAQAFDREDTEHNQIWIRAQREEGWCMIQVRDNGRGIPEENIARIFDPFFTTKPVGVGTGLGLSICHGLVESMHGSMEVESEVDVGTTFKVWLRTAPESVVPASTRRLPALNADVRGRVLVVDDEPLILRSVARLLRDEHDVETAINGIEALERIEQDEPYDLIICDLMMPEMNGMDFFQKVAASNPELADRFVFLTGGAYTESAKRFLTRVSNPKLDKPVQPTLLRSVVTSALRG